MVRGDRIRRALAVLGLVGAALLTSVGGAAPASAHANLVRSVPADGANLSVAPTQVVIDLSEAVVPKQTTVTLTNGAGEPLGVRAVDVRETDTSGNGPGLIVKPGDKGAPTTIVVDLPPLTPEVYRLVWKTLSADDLHVTSGIVVFGVDHEVTAGGRVDDPAPPAGQVLVRWLGLLGAAAAAGGVTVALCAAGLGPVRRRALLAGAVGAGAALVAAPVLLVVQTGGAGLGAQLLRRYGLYWGIREVTAAAALALCLLLLRRPPAPRRRGTASAAAALLALYATTTAMLGHVRTEALPARVVADAAHVAAALLWLGCVVVLLLTLVTRGPGRRPVLRADARDVLRPVGFVCTGALAVLLVSGLLLMSGGVASVDALLVASYGQIVLGKLVLVLLLLAAAGTTALAVDGPAAPATLRLLLGRRARGAGVLGALAVEAVLLVAVVAFGAGAASARPAVGPEWVPSSAAVDLRSAEVQDLVETLDVSPNRPGANFVTVDVFETRRPSPGPVVGVTVDAVAPDGRSVALVAEPQGEGRWLVTTDALDEAGDWRFRVVVQRQGLAPASTTYTWTVIDAGARLAAPVVSSAPMGRVLDVAAGVLAALVSGLGAGAVLRRRGGRPRRIDGGRAVDLARPGPAPGAQRLPDDVTFGEADGERVRCATEDGTVAVR